LQKSTASQLSVHAGADLNVFNTDDRVPGTAEYLAEQFDLCSGIG
jgi:hypothetical protein